MNQKRGSKSYRKSSYNWAWRKCSNDCYKFQNNIGQGVWKVSYEGKALKYVPRSCRLMGNAWDVPEKNKSGSLDPVAYCSTAIVRYHCTKHWLDMRRLELTHFSWCFTPEGTIGNTGCDSSKHRGQRLEQWPWLGSCYAKMKEMYGDSCFVIW